MNAKDNLEIVQRLLELSTNEMEYSTFPKPYRKEHIFLSNVLSDSLRHQEREFEEAFKEAINQFKLSLADGSDHGWFRNPEQLIWINTYINQLKYAIYGERFTRKLTFNEALGKEAYKDLLLQVDRTVFMTCEEKKAHGEKLNKLASELVAKILKKEKGEK